MRARSNLWHLTTNRNRHTFFGSHARGCNDATCICDKRSMRGQRTTHQKIDPSDIPEKIPTAINAVSVTVPTQAPTPALMSAINRWTKNDSTSPSTSLTPTFLLSSHRTASPLHRLSRSVLNMRPMSLLHRPPANDLRPATTSHYEQRTGLPGESSGPSMIVSR